MNNLNASAVAVLVAVSGVTGAVVFACAGTVVYWQAWLYLVIYTVGSFSITIYLMKRDPSLLRRRMRGGPLAERRGSQKIIMWLASAGWIAGLIVPGLDRRFAWSNVPLAVVLVGNVLVALCFYAVFGVFRANPFSAATVEVDEDQTVISTGPYGRVRHPMYAGGMLVFVGTPLALGSYWGLLALLATVPAVVWRLYDEERFLREHLSGYAAYCDRVRWRLLPGVF